MCGEIVRSDDERMAIRIDQQKSRPLRSMMYINSFLLNETSSACLAVSRSLTSFSKRGLCALRSILF
jgi:hypothetical protein